MEVIVEKEIRRGTKADRWTSREEEKVWVQFYRRAGDPVIAADLIEQLESDREVKARHFGLYLRCRQSLRQEKVRRARAKFLAHGVHVLGRLLIGWPLEVIRDSFSFLSAVSVAWTDADEPAVRQMHKIRRSRQAVKPSAAQEEEVKAKAKQA
jgi:hypothetical protein